MTFEELKAEAKRQGYNLIKMSKYPTIVKCPVCNKKPERWSRYNAQTHEETYIVRCPICNHKEEAKKKTWAVNQWNSWAEREARGNETN